MSSIIPRDVLSTALGGLDPTPATILLVSILTGSCLFVVYYLAWAIYYSWFHPLSGFPGPWLAKFSNLYNAVCVFGSGREPQIMFQLHRKYGPVVRVAPDVLLFSDPKLVPVIYNRQADKSSVYGAGGMGVVPSVFSVRPHEEHAIRRKKVAQPYSMTSVKPMEYMVDARITEWIATLTERFVKTEKPFDFACWSQYLVYDVISDLAFGEPVGFVRNGQDVRQLIAAFSKGLPIVGILTRLPGLMEFLTRNPLTSKFFTPNPVRSWGIGYMMKFRDEVIQKRLQNNDNHRQDFLQHIIDGLKPSPKTGVPVFTLDEAKSEILLVLAAGSDTTAGVFRAFLINLCFYFPKCYHKLLRELDDATAAGLLSSPIPTYDEGQNLPYFNACLKESMRYRPSVAAALPRVAPKDGFVYTDPKTGKVWNVPSGCQVMMHPHIAARNKDLYGEDADTFNPERWIVNEHSSPEQVEKVKEMHRLDMSWGSGARVCLGKNIALMEVTKALTMFFRRYNVQFIGKKNPKTDEIIFELDQVRQYTVAFQENLWIKIWERDVPVAR